MNNEKKYVVQLREGSTDAFDALYAIHHARLYNFILKISRGDVYLAEEIVQQTFVKLWEVRQTVDENRNLLTYICTIAKNLFLNNNSHKLVEYVYYEYIFKNGNPYDLSTEREVDRSMLDQLISELTELLPPARKKIFVMSRREGKSNRQIAYELNITESTIETQLGKAMDFMKKELKKIYGLPTVTAIVFIQFFGIQ